MFKEVRERILNDLKRDLIGPPLNEEDVLNDIPSVAYITGMLFPTDSRDFIEETDGVLSEVYGEDIEDNPERDEDGYSENEVNEESIIEENEEDQPIGKKTFKFQSSIGIGFYVRDNVEEIKVEVKWGQYKEEKEENENEEGKRNKWVRKCHRKEVLLPLINMDDSDTVSVEDGVCLKVIKHRVKNTQNLLVSVFLVNAKKPADAIENIMFQVEMELCSKNGEKIFLCENYARVDRDKFEEFIYRNKPVFGRGFGCAVDWLDYDNHCAGRIKSEFIPTHELAKVSTKLKDDINGELKEDFFSAKRFSEEISIEEIILRLKEIPKRYKYWIENLPINEVNDRYIADVNIDNCNKALERINRGIKIIEENPYVKEAFIFMNKVMHLQNSMKAYSTDNSNTTLEEELKKDKFTWRPFQLAFILMNIDGVTNPLSRDREIVDLLWFPTGGGKTEAYLGLAALLLGYRRLTANDSGRYIKDGGVTIFLRYTLRLLTTQQRDRLLKMICASEMIRAQDRYERYGRAEFSVGFWVGGQVTANSFDSLKVTYYKTEQDVKNEIKNITNQIIECPCCGTRNPHYRFRPDDNFEDNETKVALEIYCRNEECYFSKKKIPVYLIDEEIYRRTPTVVISTVDKFARLPWDENTALLFGKADRFCPRHGYIAEGADHPNSHKESEKFPACKVQKVKPFYPPEMIIQDELHLITGPLGTIYGGYETAIEELCKAELEDGTIVKPKYVVSTATIKNAGNQIEKLYARKHSFQFPPPGLSVEDSFFAKEISIDKEPFRLYAGVCASGQSMKTVLLRIYAVLLQSTENLLNDPKLKDYVDPYRTLIGYFNSIRELGGAVRLLDDDVKKRIQTLKDKYKYPKIRYIKHRELTSRVPSYRIPEVLSQLEKTTNDQDMLDVVLATNMISVGMDVDRLGLMVVTGQPKLTSEYIQASSRVGRKFPGFVVTVYNPYRPRDISHYQNFKGYHSRIYNYVEGTTATPFAARARDRVLHAIAVSLLRLTNNGLSLDKQANDIKDVPDNILNTLREKIEKRVKTVEYRNLNDTMSDLDSFLDSWIKLSNEEKELRYYFYKDSKRGQETAKRYNRLLAYYTEKNLTVERATLNSMREVENTSKLYFYTRRDGE